MTEVRLPFGMRADSGAMVSIEAVARGLDCACICPECRTPLVAAKGEIYRHHFRHQAEGACSGARETAIHRFAKQAICESLTLKLPHDLGDMWEANAEVTDDDLRYDVLATYASETVAIEIYVAHRVPMDKVRKLHERQQTAIEIDLSYYRDADRSEDEWREAVLSRAPRRWLTDPLHVRELLAEKLALMREEERRRHLAAREAQRRAEAEREVRLKAERERQAQLAAEEARQAEERRRFYQAEQERLAWLAALRRQREAEREPPNLQKLVEAHGDWRRITPEAWLRWDADSKLYDARLAGGYFYAKPTQKY